MFPKEFINSVFKKIAKIDKPRNKRKYMENLKSHCPKWIKSKFRTVSKPQVNSNVLAVGIYMIFQMKKIMSEDIKSLEYSLK